MFVLTDVEANTMSLGVLCTKLNPKKQATALVESWRRFLFTSPTIFLFKTALNQDQA